MRSLKARTKLLILSSLIVFHFVVTGCVTTESSTSAMKEPISKSSAPQKKLTEELVKIKTRLGVTQSFLIIKPVNPVAVVVLLDGGHGKLKINKFSGKIRIGSPAARGFLTRSRNAFSENGFTVALVDVPSDKQSGGILPDFRMSKEHAQDINTVVSYLKNETKLPAWLVGMSAGSFSVPNATINGNGEISGIVLVSSTTQSHERWPRHETYPNGILDMQLNKIDVPTLIVAHQNDKCEVTPPSGAFKIKEALLSSPRVEVLQFSGGRSPKFPSGPIPPDCTPLTPHGFYGIEEQVVDAITDFIRTDTK